MKDIDLSPYDNLEKSSIERPIEELAYRIKQAEPGRKPIVMIGAGASDSAGIPLTHKIVKDVKSRFIDNPSIRRLVDEGCSNYYAFMLALSADDRRTLFYEYIKAKDVKINPTSIILAQLLKEKFIDFIFTVNFDDLLIKGSTVFNSIPPTYDFSGGIPLTTASLAKNSIVYLHGQYHGQWLLNSPSEMDRVSDIARNLFQRECMGRTLIIVGYSGDDKILDKISELGNFENGLYWVKFKNQEPSEKVIKTLFKDLSKSAFLISGYDSDSFFWTLHNKLDLEIPLIYDKPFTFLKEFRDSFNSFADHLKNHQRNTLRSEVVEYYDNVIPEVINKYENDKLKEMFLVALNLLSSRNDFSIFKIDELIQKYNLSDSDIFCDELIQYYFDFVNYIIEKIGTAEEIAQEDFFELISRLNSLEPNNDQITYLWGLGLCKYGRKNKNTQMIEFGIAKFDTSLGLNPEFAMAYNDWGIALMDLGRFRKEERYFEESFEKFEVGYSLDASISRILYNWSLALFHLARLRKNDSSIFERALEKSREFQRNYGQNRTSFWLQGLILTEIAKINGDREKFKEAILLLEHAVYFSAFTVSYHKSLLVAYILYSRLLSGEERELQLNNALKVALELNKKTGKVYDLSCIRALKGEFDIALGLLKESLSKKEIKAEYVKTDKDWEAYYLDTKFIELLEQFKE